MGFIEKKSAEYICLPQRTVMDIPVYRPDGNFRASMKLLRIAQNFNRIYLDIFLFLKGHNPQSFTLKMNKLTKLLLTR